MDADCYLWSCPCVTPGNKQKKARRFNLFDELKWKKCKIFSLFLMHLTLQKDITLLRNVAFSCFCPSRVFFVQWLFLRYFRKDLIWDLDDNSTIEDLVVQISEKVLKRFVIYCLVAEKVVESDYLMAFSVFIYHGIRSSKVKRVKYIYFFCSEKKKKSIKIRFIDLMIY